MLYIIGIGLNNCDDLSLRSLKILKKCDKIYQECYTCIQNEDFKEIEKLIDKKIILANRSVVEEYNEIVENSKNYNIAFLVAGSPLIATTHTDLMIRCKNENINTKVIHNVSILNCYGLYSYNFGKIISIPYFTDSWKPISFFDNIINNYNNNLHTLCLLDIKTDENRFMSINEAIKEIEYAESVKKSNIFSLNTKLIAICRFSTDDEYVVYDTAENLLSRDFGKPLHSLIFLAKLSIIEKEMLEDLFKL